MEFFLAPCVRSLSNPVVLTSLVYALFLLSFRVNLGCCYQMCKALNNSPGCRSIEC